MTVQEKIQKKAEGFGKLAPVFLEGAEFALENRYINYKEQKPPFGVEVVAYHHKWVDEDFNPNGTRVGFLGDEGFISAFWWDYQDCYETISKLNCESNRDFYRSHIDNTEPEFWFPIPKFVNPLKNRRLNYDKRRIKKQIEYPLNHFITNEDVHFWERNHIKAIIGRTLRLALQYPNLAQEYLDSLPKATMD